MNMEENYYLLLSGIQHMAFCERQWALIHLEKVWNENVLTVEGKHLHERADNPFEDETRKDVRIVRSVPVISHRLKLQGIADVIEFQLCKEPVPGETCRLDNRSGWWRPVPIEYKHGRPKPDDRDAVQLCAQAMALEEMLGVSIKHGYLFYGQTKRREVVVFDEKLRRHTCELAIQMQCLAAAGCTPPAKNDKRCRNCSLIEQCQPRLVVHKPVDKYIRKMCRVEETV